MSIKMTLDPLNLSPPRFSFRENRKRSPVAGHVSALKYRPLLFQILDSDVTDGVASSWMLDKYQKIVAHRSTRLSVREHKQLARHVKRMRHLLILNTQNTDTRTTKLDSQRYSAPRRRTSYSRVRSGPQKKRAHILVR